MQIVKKDFVFFFFLNISNLKRETSKQFLNKTYILNESHKIYHKNILL